MLSGSEASPAMGLRITCVHQVVLKSIPPESFGQAMKLGELANALKRYGVCHRSRRTLLQWVTQGKRNKYTGETIQMPSNCLGDEYESTIVDYCEFMEKFKTPQHSPESPPHSVPSPSPS
jgi:hypothetical protein